MSETSETKGRCRQQIEAWYANNSSSVPRYSWMIADAIDRLAADVAAVMEMTQEIALRVPSEFGQDACDAAVRVALKERDAAVRERDEWREEARLAVINRDEARAEVERLRAELAARQAVNSPEITDSSPADPQPAAPAAGWLTDEERELLALVNGMADAYSLDPRSTWRCNWPYSRVSLVVKALLARAGSPPVVVLPSVFQRGSLGDELVALQQVKDSLDKAGVKWEEVGRE